MLHEKICLRTDRPDITLTTYVADNKSILRDALLVIPGGGYWDVCVEREGEPIALEFLAKGYNTFVLNYSVRKNAASLNPLIEASLAMAHIKANAEKYNINPNRVFATGFSAGGHLAGCLGTMWHLDEIYKRTGLEYGINKPTGVILCYPVISGVEHPHIGSFYNLLDKENPSREELEFFSLERRVDERSAPAFLYHTFNDTCVPYQNSMAMAMAYGNAGIPCELHLYPDAPHGAALGTKITMNGCDKFDNPSIALWTTLADAWMKQVK